MRPLTRLAVLLPSRTLTPVCRRCLASSAAAPSATETPASAPAPEDAVPKSGTPAGTPLKNINFIQGRPDPVALPDDQYPAWLWDVLKEKEGSGSAENVGDAYSKSKKARQLAAKTARRLAKLGPTEQPIPLDEQTLDLPYATTAPAAPAPSARHLVSAAGPVRPADGSPEAQAVNKVVEIGEGAREVSPEEADRAREAVRRERRKKSRAGIKERNFLQAM